MILWVRHPRASAGTPRIRRAEAGRRDFVPKSRSGSGLPRPSPQFASHPPGREIDAVQGPAGRARSVGASRSRTRRIWRRSDVCWTPTVGDTSAHGCGRIRESRTSRGTHPDSPSRLVGSRAVGVAVPRSKRFRRNLGRKLPSPKPIRTTIEWVRFEHAREPFGVFSYIRSALPGLSRRRRERLEILRKWFNDNLGAPTQATLERFWFRAEAQECIEKARQLAELVSSTGIPIVERHTRRVPGKVRWEDTHQAAVLTYRDTPQPRRQRQIRSPPVRES